VSALFGGIEANILMYSTDFLYFSHKFGWKRVKAGEEIIHLSLGSSRYESDLLNPVYTKITLSHPVEQF
jgi:hypothetical protein